MISHGTNTLPLITISEWDLAVRAIKVEFLDKEQESLKVVATGFIFEENEKQHLYIPWHAVTGYSFPNVKLTDLPNRRYARLIIKRLTSTSPGHYSLGNSLPIIISLYDENGKPVWLQDQFYRPNADLDKFHLHIPRHNDLVAIPIDIEKNQARFICYTPDQTFSGAVQNGQKITLTGYPWGYSALGSLTPEPLFVVRHIASWVVERAPDDFLLDGVGAKGMSGSPIFIRNASGFKLIGVYIRAVFPDAAETGRSQDIYSTLGVGIRFGCRFHFSRDHKPISD